MAKLTYLTADGSEKTFNQKQLMALVKGKQTSDENGDHRVSQNAVMEDLASNIHVSFSSIKHWVNGHNSPGSLEIVSQIASYFNVKTE